MTDPALVFGEGHAGRRLVVNFGVFSGREATEAEIYRLAQTLLEEAQRMDPSSAAVAIDLGRVLLGQGKSAEAEVR